MTDAKETTLDDGQAVKHAIATGAARSGQGKSEVHGHLQNITAAEAKKPWGTAEYGREFEKNYNGPHGNAQFIKTNVEKIFDNTHQGFELSFRAVDHTIEIDEDGQAIFKDGHKEPLFGNSPGAVPQTDYPKQQEA
jgi:hypothetical protein